MTELVVRLRRLLEEYEEIEKAPNDFTGAGRLICANDALTDLLRLLRKEYKVRAKETWEGVMARVKQKEEV